MKVLVINGSPKGRNSITLQTALYLEKVFPSHSFSYLQAGAQIRALEKDFSPALDAVRAADVLLFCYPVYTFMAPSQLHRFIRLLKEQAPDLSGKFASQITTSKHFYDTTAHRFIERNCFDLGLKVVHGLSADMDDLTTEKGQKEARGFLRYLAWCVARDLHEPFPAPEAAYQPRPVTVPQQAGPAEKPGDVVVVTDCAPEDAQLDSMIRRFIAVCPRRVRVVRLNEFPFRGGCLGCFHCATDGTCVYQDGFDTFLRETIQRSEAIVYAFRIVDHSMGPLFKCYDDRQFCNGHRTVTMGAPQGYLISGPYSRENDLKLVIDGRSGVGGNFLCGTATDERDPDSEIDRMAATLDWAIRHHHTQPADFLGVGGMKIFRDLIWLMRGMMREDHRFFKAHGQYDFPQKQKGRALAMYLVGAMLRSKKLQKKAGGRMTEGMLMPYTKVLRSAVPMEEEEA